MKFCSVRFTVSVNSRPAPNIISEMAVVRIIAMVIVTFRRRPVTTSLKTNWARI